MASGEPEADHVLLGIAVRLAHTPYALAKRSKKLFLVNHACFLGNIWAEHHERISGVPEQYQTDTSDRRLYCSPIVREDDGQARLRAQWSPVEEDLVLGAKEGFPARA